MPNDEHDSAGGGSVGKEEKKHTKQQRMLIVIGIVSLILVYVMMRRSSSANSAAAQQAALASQYGPGNPYYNSGSSGGGTYSDPNVMQALQGIQSIQSELAGLTTMISGGPSGGGTATPTPGTLASMAVPLTSQVVVGEGYSLPGSGPNGGYGTGFVEDLTGAFYTPYTTADATKQAFSNGQQVFYEPSLGDFVPITSQQMFQQLEQQSQRETGAGFTTFSKVKTA